MPYFKVTTVDVVTREYYLDEKDSEVARQVAGDTEVMFSSEKRVAKGTQCEKITHKQWLKGKSQL